LAGGGTDVSPYSDLYGGAILNTTISLYAKASIELLDTDDIILEAKDQNEKFNAPFSDRLLIDGKLDLLKGVYNSIQQQYTFPKQGFKLTTHVDTPAGSGLGTSSTLVVAILGAFVELLKLPMSDYDIAHYAYKIEREELGLAGGKQDQYAATFGGVNYMEFYEGNKVIVNPLRIKEAHLFELENNLLLYYTATSRESAAIIKKQKQNVEDKKQSSIDAMHQLKEQALLMKEALLKGDLNEVGAILDNGFQQKRKMAEGISNPLLEEIYDTAKKAGATGGKISGAGGGGFMIFYCPGNTKYNVAESLQQFGGKVGSYHFVNQGLKTWRT
jgi:D-glycero-alpha-D-manno-heptose-7-phosphate kinase